MLYSEFKIVAIAETPVEWPINVLTNSPVSWSHTLTIQSLEPVTIKESVKTPKQRIVLLCLIFRFLLWVSVKFLLGIFS